MPRSLKKGPFVDEHLLAKVDASERKRAPSRSLKTWSPSFHHSPRFIGHTFAVHDGRKHVPVYVDDSMVGHKLGEFAPPRPSRVTSKRRRRDVDKR